MKLTAAILIAAGGLHASPTGNSIDIVEVNRSAIAARPITIGRPFQKGEFQQFVRPVVNGVPAAPYQNDNCNRWADGSLKWCAISFWLPAMSPRRTVHVAFETTPSRTSPGIELDKNAILAFDSGNYDSSIEISNGSTAQSATLKSMIAAGAFRYRLKGPVVTEIIAEGGASAASDNLDPAHAFDYDMGFDAYKSLHPIFVATFYPGWSGVRVQGILENAWGNKLEDVIYSYTIRKGNGLATTVKSETGIRHYIMARWHYEWWDGAQPGTVDIDHNFAYLTRTKAIPNYKTDLALSANGLNAQFQAWSDCAHHFNTFNRPCEYQFIKHGMPGPGGHPMRGIVPLWDVKYLYHPVKQPSDPVRLWDVVEAAASRQAAEIPVKLREGVNRGFYCQYKCTGANAAVPAFGRYETIDNRPNLKLKNGFDTDPIPVGPATSGDPNEYGERSWIVDIAHQPMPTYLAYLLTGDWFYLDELIAIAHWNMGNIAWDRHGDIGYVYGDPGSNQVRGVGWLFRTLFYAAFIAPDGSPEQEYLLGIVRDNAKIYEGQLGILNGNYPPQNAACSAWPSDWANDSSVSQQTKRSDLWCLGSMFGPRRMSIYPFPPNAGEHHSVFASKPNPLKFLWSHNAYAGVACPYYLAQGTAAGPVNPATGQDPQGRIDYRNCGTLQLLWHEDIVRMALQLSLDLDLRIGGVQPFKKFMAVWNENLFGMYNAGNMTPYLLGLYTSPLWALSGDHMEQFQTWNDWYAGLGTTVKNTTGWDQSPPVLDGNTSDGDVGTGSWESVKHRRFALFAMLYNETDANGLTGKQFFDRFVAAGFNYNLPSTLADPGWAIAPYQRKFALVTGALPDGWAGRTYVGQVAVADGKEPVAYAVADGSLPPGLTLSGSAITGTPSQPGTYRFTVQAKDSASASASREFSIMISKTPDPLSIATPALRAAYAGRPYAETLEAAGGVGPYGWMLESGSLPSGLALAGGSIVGTPSGPGAATFGIRVMDSGEPSGSAVRRFTLSVAEDPERSGIFRGGR